MSNLPKVVRPASNETLAVYQTIEIRDLPLLIKAVQLASPLLLTELANKQIDCPYTRQLQRAVEANLEAINAIRMLDIPPVLPYDR